jgi:hypothetical protein
MAIGADSFGNAAAIAEEKSLLKRGKSAPVGFAVVAVLAKNKLPVKQPRWAVPIGNTA